MYIKLKNIVLTAGIMLSVFLAAALASCSSNHDFSLTVLLLQGDDITVTSENPIKVPYGGSAEFSLGINDGKTITEVLCDGEPTENYIFENGVLTVENVTAPHTLRIAAGNPDEKCEFWISSNTMRGGGAVSVPAQGRIVSGSYVTFSASPNDGAVFLGWSENKSIAKGGKLLSNEEQLTLKIDSDITVFANYDASKVPEPERPEPPKIEIPQKDNNWHTPQVSRENVIEITYDACGGITSDGESILNTDFCLDYYTMPNSLPENGTFERSGYVLSGYNTKSDGSGDYIGMGHKFYVDSLKPVTLYCMWEKEEPAQNFTYSESEGNISIDKYNGLSANVYIPKYIDGKPVTKISGNAFSGSSISFVYIPSTVITVESGAFSGCTKLEKIMLFDSLRQISDESFSGTQIKTVSIHAATAPKYSDTDLSFGKKYERFICSGADGLERIIVVAGSSKHFGLDSDYADSLLGDKYAVVNYGTNAQMNVVFFLEAMSNLAVDGDIIIFAPEQYGPYCDTVNGNPAMTALTFQGCESCYNLIEYVDVSKYTGFFDSFSQYSIQRSGMRDKSYESYSRNIDAYGDCSISRRSYNSDSYRNGANGTFFFKEDTVPAEFADNVNRILAIAQSRGIPVYLSYPPYNINACDEDCLNDDSYDAYNRDMEKTFSAQLISDVRNYIYEGKYFYNTDYHLIEEGAQMHTKQLVDDIIKSDILE